MPFLFFDRCQIKFKSTNKVPSEFQLNIFFQNGGKRLSIHPSLLTDLRSRSQPSVTRSRLVNKMATQRSTPKKSMSTGRSKTFGTGSGTRKTSEGASVDSFSQARIKEVKKDYKFKCLQLKFVTKQRMYKFILCCNSLLVVSLKSITRLKCTFQ